MSGHSLLTPYECAKSFPLLSLTTMSALLNVLGRTPKNEPQCLKRFGTLRV